eukprot:8093766-Pyramimonas_sp.AAC.1
MLHCVGTSKKTRQHRCGLLRAGHRKQHGKLHVAKFVISAQAFLLLFRALPFALSVQTEAVVSQRAGGL